MLKLICSHGDDDLARVFVVELADGSRVECVESVQPPIPRDQKWVLIVSTLKGCPVGCAMCDAGQDYRGKLSCEEILAQVDLLIRRRYPSGRISIPKLKVQLARMGEPALNDAVLDALEAMPARFDAPGLLPSLSTVAPAGRESFFERLLDIKNRLYGEGHFQMQFSVHSTDETARRKMVPIRTWSLAQMAAYGERFYKKGDRKVTLNFALAEGLPADPNALVTTFDPLTFAIKLTPINPTRAANRSGLRGLVAPEDPDACRLIAQRFEAKGYDTIVSIGELEENRIGSNCGMYVSQGLYRDEATACSSAGEHAAIA
ncbi:MAG: radical SAM protein [Myxococcota bacterium]|jgi:23S rRNA (adenine2503-C2)-methyltransferase|nr:radical SAM protein [Myxococcota bacterium]